MLRDGVATVVLASGALAEVAAERIVFSVATAHLYERAQSVGMMAGNAVLQPVVMDAWQTYNFEVEDLHTYVAGGVRVHNASGEFVDIPGVGRFQMSHSRFDKYGLPEFARVIGPGDMPNTHETVRPGGGYRTVYSDNLVNGDPNPFAGADWQPGGDYDENGVLEDSDHLLHDADIYDRQAEEALAGGNPLQAQYYEDRARENREAAGELQGSGNGSDDDDDVNQAEVDAAVQVAIDAALTPAEEDTPIILDLDGNGIQITELSQSTVFIVDEDGLEHRTAWVGRGDGVLFFDVGNDGKISETREYVFTEWDPTARSDFEALRARFDSNNDGRLTSADAAFGQFKVMVTKADGTLEAQTLTQLGISEIDLTGDTTDIRLPDGSVITGQSTFTINGVERTAADLTLMAEAQGYEVTPVVVVATNGYRTTTHTARDSDGDTVFRIESTVSPGGTQTLNRYDDIGDGQYDRTQRITIAVDGNTRTETRFVGSTRAT